MNRVLPSLLTALAAGLLLAGCAGTAASPGAPRIERLAPQALAAQARTAPRPLSMDALVRLARENPDPAALEDRIRDHGVDFELDATRSVELHRRGVPADVLDHLLQAQQQARLHALAMEREARETALRRQLEDERRYRDRYLYDPWWPHPWMGWHPHRRGPDASFGLWWGW